jgi:hypothetical protein
MEIYIYEREVLGSNWALAATVVVVVILSKW